MLALLLGVEAWGLCQLFSGRGAFIQFGAALGTIMVANVFFVIIPGQRELVRAKQENREPDPIHGIRGKQRSVHNTYFTLPVLFTMISNHYAMTYGARYNWLVLIAHEPCGRRDPHLVRCASQGARARRQDIAGAALLVGVLSSSLVDRRAAAAQRAQRTTAAERFRECRSRSSSSAVSLPLRDADATRVSCAAGRHRARYATSTSSRASRTTAQLETRTMPIGNLTGMTDEERATVLAWIRQWRPAIDSVECSSRRAAALSQRSGRARCRRAATTIGPTGVLVRDGRIVAGRSSAG